MSGYDSDMILFSKCSCFVSLWLLYCPGRLPEPSLVDSLSSETLPNGHFRWPPSSGHMFSVYHPSALASSKQGRSTDRDGQK